MTTVHIHLRLTLNDAAVDRLVGRPDDGGPVWAAEAREEIADWVRDSQESWRTFQEGSPEVKVEL